MKIRVISIILCILMCLLMLASCGEKKKAQVVDGLLGIIAAYKGPTVTDVDYEFTKSDFYVLASYTGDKDAETKDYDFEVEGLKNGYFRVKFYYGGETAICDVKCNVNIYPSDKDTYVPGAEHEHDHG